MADTAMERWEAYINSGGWTFDDPMTRAESTDGIRLALEAAKEIGALERVVSICKPPGPFVEIGDPPLYRIIPDALEEG